MAWCVAGMVAAVLGAAPAAAASQQRGPVTDLPIPRFVSLKTDKANARRGPDYSHRIDWVYTRRDTPLRVVAEFEHWRRVVDIDGQGGWVHFRLLSGERTALVSDHMVPARRRATPDAPAVARLERGVIGKIAACNPDWCRLNMGDVDGWVPKDALWGVFRDEVLD